jgi:CheY-like chemotaxis protein
MFAIVVANTDAIVESQRSQAKALRPDLPVIMITAYGDADTQRRALEGGAETLLTKPIDFGALRSEIDTRIAQAA